MAPESLCREGIERHEIRIVDRGWDVPEVSTPDDIICGEWAIRFACDFDRLRVGLVSPDFSLWTHEEMLRKLALKLSKEISARASVFTPILNPILQSALATLSKADNLTASELIALNNVIGSASIQNRFDIETFYVNEDEVSR